MRKCILLFITLIFSWSSFSQSITIDNVSKHITHSGDKITISGSGFDTNPSNLKVAFGAVGATILSSTNYQIEVLVPRGATFDNINVHNLNTGLSATSKRLFLLAYGGTTFNPAKLSAITEFSAQQGLYDLCLCDFDNDGKVDIATANTDSNSITVLSNSSTSIGNISFSTNTVLINSKTLNIQCADLNNDGKSEILLSKTGTVSNIVFYLKNISTTSTIEFELPVALNLDGSTARRIEVADLNLDGKPDIIASNQTNNKINVFRNLSTTSAIKFDSSPTTFEVPGISNSSGLKVKDLNNDKLPDIAISPYLSSNVYILKNKSTTSTIDFYSPSTISIPGTIVNLEIGDLNKDNKPDLITTKLTANGISIIKNTSTSGGNISFGGKVDINTAKRPWGIGLGDFNGDRKLDIAITSINESSRILTLLINNNTSAGGDPSLEKYDITTTQKAQNIKVGDLNGDGKPEIALTGIGDNNVYIFANQHCLIPSIFGDLNRTLCDGGQLALRTSGGPGATYTWYKSDGSNEWVVKNSSEPFYNEAVSTSGNFTYRVVAKQGLCTEESPEEVTLQVIGDAVSTLTGIADIPPACENSSFTLTAQGDFSQSTGNEVFVWTKPDNTTINTSSPTLTIANAGTSDAGEYKVYLQVSTCISNTVSTNVQIVSTSRVDIVASNGLFFCSGLSTTLSVPQASNNTYKWYKNGELISPGGSLYEITVSQPGQYSVEIQTAAGCTITPHSVTVDVFDEPTAGFTVANTSCTGQKTIFTNTSDYRGDDQVNFRWNFGDSQFSNEKNPAHTYTRAGEYTITLTVSYDDNCKDTTTKNITIEDADIFSITAQGPTSFCEGNELILSAPDGYRSYQWNDTQNSNTQSISVATSGTYAVTVINDNNCSSSEEIAIEVFPLPGISIDIETVEGKTHLIASGGVRYEWEPDNTLFGNDTSNPEVIPETTTTYRVRGYDGNGCSNTSEVTIKVNPNDAFSKIFTPNNDGENDLWVVKNVDQYQNCTISIFNRSGQVVFEKKNYNNDWDGTLNGKDLQEGVYYYLVKCDDTDIQSLTGSITLFR